MKKKEETKQKNVEINENNTINDDSKFLNTPLFMSVKDHINYVTSIYNHVKTNMDEDAINILDLKKSFNRINNNNSDFLDNLSKFTRDWIDKMNNELENNSKVAEEDIKNLTDESIDLRSQTFRLTQETNNLNLQTSKNENDVGYPKRIK